MKYYPYHLDKNYDDEDGNPYDAALEKKMMRMMINGGGECAYQD